jgi:hypothetical protein
MADGNIRAKVDRYKTGVLLSTTEGEAGTGISPRKRVPTIHEYALGTRYSLVHLFRNRRERRISSSCGLDDREEVTG